MDRQIYEQSDRKFLTSRIPKYNEDNSSNISFNNGSEIMNKYRPEK